MRIRDGIKFGIGFYFGRKIFRAFDYAFCETCKRCGLAELAERAAEDIIKQFRELVGLEPEKKPETEITDKNPIGFRMSE